MLAYLDLPPEVVGLLVLELPQVDVHSEVTKYQNYTLIYSCAILIVFSEAKLRQRYLPALQLENR